MKLNLTQQYKVLLAALEASSFNIETEGIDYEYSYEELRAIIKVFSSAIATEMFRLQHKENIPDDDSMKMIKKFAEELRAIIKTYSNIDTFVMYDKETMNRISNIKVMVTDLSDIKGNEGNEQREDPYTSQN